MGALTAESVTFISFFCSWKSLTIYAVSYSAWSFIGGSSLAEPHRKISAETIRCALLIRHETFCVTVELSPRPRILFARAKIPTSDIVHLFSAILCKGWGILDFACNCLDGFAMMCKQRFTRLRKAGILPKSPKSAMGKLRRLKLSFRAQEKVSRRKRKQKGECGNSPIPKQILSASGRPVRNKRALNSSRHRVLQIFTVRCYGAPYNWGSAEIIGTPYAGGVRYCDDRFSRLM